MSPRPTVGADPRVYAEKVAAAMKDELGLEDGVDVVLECSGAGACIQMGIFVAKRGATLVQAGMVEENIVFPITAVCTVPRDW